MITLDQLSTLLADPTRTENIPHSNLPAILGQVEQLRATLWSQLVRPPEREIERPDPPKVKQNQLLTADEAAERLGVTRNWMYRRADSLPFTRRIGKRTLRFSETGIERWLETRN